MTNITTLQPHPTTERLAEAARYALLRRLAPAIRHDMAGALQPISMVAVLLEKRLQKPVPDLAVIGKNVHDINTLAREASAVCMQLMSWLAPKQDAPVAIHDGVQDAISLVATELSFQGVTLVNDTASAASAVPVTLPLSVLRGLFMASLLALTDTHSGPATVVLGAAVEAGHTVLSFTRTAAAAEGDHEDGHEEGHEEAMAATSAPSAYRALDWDDVRALAAVASATLVLAQGGGRVELRFPH